MLPYAAFHLGLHFLSKYLFTGIEISRMKGVNIKQRRVGGLGYKHMYFIGRSAFLIFPRKTFILT